MSEEQSAQTFIQTFTPDDIQVLNEITEEDMMGFIGSVQNRQYVGSRRTLGQMEINGKTFEEIVRNVKLGIDVDGVSVDRGKYVPESEQWNKSTIFKMLIYLQDYYNSSQANMKPDKKHRIHMFISGLLDAALLLKLDPMLTVKLAELHRYVNIQIIEYGLSKMGKYHEMLKENHNLKKIELSRLRALEEGHNQEIARELNNRWNKLNDMEQIIDSLRVEEYMGV